jgi:hypothetical protein
VGRLGIEAVRSPYLPHQRLLGRVHVGVSDPRDHVGLVDDIDGAEIAQGGDNKVGKP